MDKKGQEGILIIGMTMCLIIIITFMIIHISHTQECQECINVCAEQGFGLEDIQTTLDGGLICVCNNMTSIIQISEE